MSTDPSTLTAAIQGLAEHIKGSVIAPGDPAYDDVRTVWNSMHDRRPAVIVRVAETQDVVTALRFARAHDLPLAVRGGGHSVAGNGTVADGLVVDLRDMRAVSVDQVGRVVAVDGGATLGDMDRATQELGLAVPTGVVSATGVAGLTLGGGVGWLTRAHGLAADNLLAADVVLADGSLVRAAPDEDAELLWGLRGGGGNFGIATRLYLQAYPLGPAVLAGAMIYHRPRWADALRAFRRWTADLPDPMTAIVTFITLPAAWDVADEPVMLTGFAWADADAAEGHRLIARLRDELAPDLEVLDPTTWTAWQSSMDEVFVGRSRAYWKNVALDRLDDGAISAIVDRAEALPTDRTGFDIHHMGGAAGRVPVDATAFPNRTAPYWVNAYAIWDEASDDDRGIGWARSVRAALEPFAAAGEYVNFLGAHETDGDTAAASALRAYGHEQLRRLVALKRRVDPANVLRRNQNILPDLDI